MFETKKEANKFIDDINERGCFLDYEICKMSQIIKNLNIVDAFKNRVTTEINIIG